MAELFLWTIACWLLLLAACAYFRDALGRRWRIAAGLSLVASVLVAVGLVFLAPPIGGYDPLAARFWISRAAAESDAAEKESHVRRVAMASAEHGWFTASQAIGTVEDAVQRCRLRTILANVPGIRNRQRLGNEARDECNASIAKGRS